MAKALSKTPTARHRRPPPRGMLWHVEGSAPGGFSDCALRGQPWAACLGISWNALDKACFFENILECSRLFCRVLLAGLWDCFEPYFEVLKGPGGGKISPQRRLGPILEPLQLLEGSWRALGGLLEPFGSEQKLVLNGSWPPQGHQGDWFRIAWGPNGHPKWAQEGFKTGSQSE